VQRKRKRSPERKWWRCYRKMKYEYKEKRHNYLPLSPLPSLLPLPLSPLPSSPL
jgi:hypothetical protein